MEGFGILEPKSILKQIPEGSEGRLYKENSFSEIYEQIVNNGLAQLSCIPYFKALKYHYVELEETVESLQKKIDELEEIVENGHERDYSDNSNFI